MRRTIINRMVGIMTGVILLLCFLFALITQGA
jgi:hypothetical protein